MRLCILAVGHKLPEWVAKGCAEYIKRMPRELALSVSEIKPEPRGSKNREQLLAAEKGRLQAALQGFSRIVVLDERGADLSTLWSGLGASLALCVVTVLIMLVLLVPTMVIVHIRSRRLERAIEWVATLPLIIPAIVLVVGLGPIYRWLSADVLSTNPIWLCFAYVVLVMPFAFRALAVGLNSIDVKTLCEASRSLGASWPRVFFRVLIPNLWQSILSASFISIAVVLGEYTVASLLGRMNLQVALYQLGQSNSQISTAMSLLALLFGVILLVALDLISGAMRRNKEGDNS